MSADLLELFRNVFGPPRLERAVPMDLFFMSLAPVVNGWKQGRNPLTGRVFWHNRAGRVRRNPPPMTRVTT
jgi:hypothetical protein